MASISGQNTSNIDNVDGFFTSQGGGGTASPTPTLTAIDTYGTGEATITNMAAYTSVVFQCEIYVGSTLIVSNANTTKNGGTITWADTSLLTGTRTVQVRAQEFGDFIQSAVGSTTYTKTPTTFRYFRCRAVTSTGSNTSSHMGIRDWRYENASATIYPSNMTADNLPTPFVASAGHYYSTYYPYKAFDSSTGSWAWTLTSSAANNYVEIDMGASVTLVTGKIMFYSGSSASHFTISGSTDGTNYTILADTVALGKTNAYQTLL